MMTRRSWVVYGMLVAIWAMLMIWQAAEHLRGRQAFQHKVVDRGRYISTTCGRLLRARSFFGVVYQERLEAALNTLVDTNEVRSVQLLNTNGEALASAGVPFELPPRNDLEGGVLWGDNTVIVENPVDLGTNVPQLVLPREIREELRSLETNRVPAAQRLARPGPPLLDACRGIQGTHRKKGRAYFCRRHVHRAGPPLDLERSLDANDYCSLGNGGGRGLRTGLAQSGKDFGIASSAGSGQRIESAP
jgi:hypothetical protein